MHGSLDSFSQLDYLLLGVAKRRQGKNRLRNVTDSSFCEGQNAVRSSPDAIGTQTSEAVSK
jgi:hypothetical protein